MEILYPSNRVYLWCAVASNPIVVLIGNMNNRRNKNRRLQEEVAKAGGPPHDEKLPPLEENANVDKAPANPTPMMEAEMRNILAQMDKEMPSQAQAATVQAQSMMAQANRDTALHSHQQVTSMTSRVRDFSRKNPPTLYDLRLMNTPKNSLIRSTRYYMLWGCLQVRRSSWPQTNSRMWLKLGMCNGGIIGR